jgi:starvation-inducible DNA-binding protein
MKINTGMTDKSRKEMAKQLSHFLADSYSLYLKTQNFHWNVKGPQFFSLHLLFEKQYTEMAGAIDEIAERVAALGYFVDGSFTAFQKQCCVKGAIKKPLKASAMVQQLVKDHDVLIQCAREISHSAEEENDPATVDLMARRLNAHEKFAWMLRSQL